MNRWTVALRLVGVGWYIGGSIILGVLGGRWLDTKLHTEPIMVIVGLLCGIFIAFYGTYRMLLPSIIKKRDKENG